DTRFWAPRNASSVEEGVGVESSATDVGGLIGCCRRERIDFVVVGREAPLVLGLVETLEAEGIPAFARDPASLRSKAYAKDLCGRARMPSAAYGRFHVCSNRRRSHRRPRHR